MPIPMTPTRFQMRSWESESLADLRKRRDVEIRREFDPVPTNGLAMMDASGVHVGKCPPFGYQRDADGRLEIHPQAGLAITELFRRRAQGEPVRHLCRWLEAQGFVTGNGNLGWTTTSLRHIFANRTYLGELHSGTHVALATHQPLVDEVVWQAAQAPRELPTKRRGKRPTLLGGLLRCAGCRMVLHSQVENRSGGRLCSTYICHGRSSGGKCPSPASISGSLIEPYVEEAFFSGLRVRGRRQVVSKRRLEELERRVGTAKEQLAVYRDAPMVLTTLGRNDYIAGLLWRKQRVALALSAVAQERRRLEPIMLPGAEEVENSWPGMTINERRLAIADVIECVFVERGKRQVRERSFIFSRGQGPLDLPRRGSKGQRVHAFDRSEHAAQRKIYRAPAWPAARIEAELTAFVGDRTQWPYPEDFHRAGYGPLFRQVLCSGGPAHWAGRLGLVPLKGSQALRGWDDGAIRATLARFLRGKSYWPTPRQFKASGYAAIYRTLVASGEIDRWVDEFGLPRQSDGWCKPG